MKENKIISTALEKGERFSDLVLEEIKLHLEPKGYGYSRCEENHGHTFRRRMSLSK